jgi:hypothetical protein
MNDLDDDEDLDDSEYPDEPEADGDDSDETIPCPFCGEPVYEEAERCPSCGQYLSREDAPRRIPAWFLLGVILSLAVVLGWILAA